MEISISDPASRFSEHLALQSNSRILLSGKFGIGKSHFLSAYFKDKVDAYNVFSISPIHYVVGANHDIFEWIKVDIAKQFITNYLPRTQEEAPTTNFFIQSYLYQHASAMFFRLAKYAAGKATEAKTGINFVDALKDDLKAFEEFKAKAKDNMKNDWDQFNNILIESTQMKGSIFEDNLVTQVIRANLELLKKESGKENVLIIDDLDRLDPEHIFRILNILSAHNDHFDSNKFGFDKVILVCDKNNIESMYRFRYSEHADFEGYIEKFYTYEPFCFSMTDAIIEYCENKEVVANLDQSNVIVLRILLVALLKSGKINIRNLRKLISFPSQGIQLHSSVRIYRPNESSKPPIIHESIVGTSDFKIDFSKFDFIKVVIMLSVAFGGIRKLRSTLTNLPAIPMGFTEADLKSVVDALAIISHIAKGFPGPKSSIFYSIHKMDQNNMLGTKSNPIISFLGKGTALELPWINGNRYVSGDYFERANPFVILRHLEEANRKQAFSLSTLINEILPVIDFLIDEFDVSVNR